MLSCKRAFLRGYEMTIDKLKDEFIRLYDVPKFDFNTPVYKQIHNKITGFIYKNHLEDTEEWTNISANLLYKSTQYMTRQEADTIVLNLELLKRKLLSRKNEGFEKYLHPIIKQIAFNKFDHHQYADSVEAAFKEINSRLKKICRKLGYEEKDGVSLMNFIFSENNPVLKFEDISTSSGRDVQKGYMQIFAGAMAGIRNPKAHENMFINRDAAIKRLIFASLLMDKIDEALNYSGIIE